MPTLTTLPALPETINGLPNISGSEKQVLEIVNHNSPVFLPNTNLKLEDITATFAVALHMHQPTIPAGANGEYISHLQYMFEHQGEGDNHNAGPFANCY
ncbi:MAG: glycosyl hydrolase family 57, partial [Cyanobacteria bacterium J06621_15]